MSLAEDNKGRIWVGTYGYGFGYIDNGKVHKIDQGLWKGISVFDIACESNGTLWLATMGLGLVRCDPDGHYTFFKEKQNAYNNRKINSIPNNFLTDIVLSKDGRHIYVTTSVGLACYDKAADSWTNTFGGNILQKDKMTTCVFEDYEGKVWFGCNGALYVYDPVTKKVKTYTTADGLPSNSISFITQDRSGKIWVGTKNGLSCKNVRTGKIMNFFADNGLQGNEFGDHAVSKNRDGTLFLVGGLGGINWFNPLNIHLPRWNATVVITGVFSGDNKNTIDDKNLTFEHDDNSFTLFLSTNTYNDVEQISFLYKLDGDDWEALPQGKNNLMFTRMPAGKHTLKLKAVKNGQETPVKEYTIRVKAAWYATPIAKILYVFIFCFIIWLIRKDYNHKRHISHLLKQMKDIKKFVVPINKDIETQTPDDKLMERVMKYVNEHLNDSELSVEKVADAVGISRVHLHRKLKEITGQTPHALIKNLRLRQAAKLLENPKQSIADIVYSCGFSNTASFSTMFKAEYGVSPREYQKGKRAKNESAEE